MSGVSERLNYFVDLDRYPIHDLDSDEGQALIARCHKMMDRDTLCLLDGFLRTEAIATLSAEITQLQEKVYRIDHRCTPYGWMNNAGFPPEHPRSQLLRRHCGVIATDQLNPAGACMGLFAFDELTEFVCRLMRYDTLYRSACPTLSVQINTMNEGEEFGWHFDTNDGVVSLAIQNANNGGAFEYAPLIRDENDENYPAVGRVMSNIYTPRCPEISPGTFSLFLGRRSLHRVAPVGKTTRTRQSLLYSYDREPGMVFPKKTRRRITSESPEPYLGALTPVN